VTKAHLIIEAVSLLACIIAVAGVVLNNRKMRLCFPLWVASNLLSLAVHLYSWLFGMVLRDIVFIILAVEGWILWKEKKDGDKT
jgi:nicotinamide riboside transporter PnuC